MAPRPYPKEAQWGDRAGIMSWDSKGSSMLTPRQREKEEHPVASCPASAAVLAVSFDPKAAAMETRHWRFTETSLQEGAGPCSGPSIRIKEASWVVRSPLGLSPKKGGGTATHKGSTTGLAEGWGGCWRDFSS